MNVNLLRPGRPALNALSAVFNRPCTHGLTSARNFFGSFCKLAPAASHCQLTFLHKRAQHLTNYSQVRWKKKQSNKKVEEDLSDDEDEKFKAEPGTSASQVTVTSARIDLVLKSCWSMPRNKIEVLFYEGKVRVNEEKLKKKSEMVRVGDIIDIVKGPSKENPEKFMNVDRIEILAAEQKDADRLILHVDKQRKLLVNVPE